MCQYISFLGCVLSFYRKLRSLRLLATESLNTGKVPGTGPESVSVFSYLSPSVYCETCLDSHCTKFVDLYNCSKRTKEEIKEALSLIFLHVYSVSFSCTFTGILYFWTPHYLLVLTWVYPDVGSIMCKYPWVNRVQISYGILCVRARGQSSAPGPVSVILLPSVAC